MTVPITLYSRNEHREVYRNDNQLSTRLFNTHQNKRGKLPGTGNLTQINTSGLRRVRTQLNSDSRAKMDDRRANALKIQREAGYTTRITMNVAMQQEVSTTRGSLRQESCDIAPNHVSQQSDRLQIRYAVVHLALLYKRSIAHCTQIMVKY